MAGRIAPGRVRLAVAVALMIFVLVVGLRQSRPGTDVVVRSSERGRLTALVATERDRVGRLRVEVADLRDRVEQLQGGAGRDAGEADGLAGAREAAGLVAERGPGLLVTLDDASPQAVSEQQDEGVSLNDLVIHSQDVQTVANALWAAGAEAMAVNGERVIPTSALLCVGNTLLINGTVHAPPYRFEALGSASELRERFAADEAVREFKATAERFHLGFQVQTSTDLDVPAYRGSIRLRYARPR